MLESTLWFFGQILLALAMLFVGARLGSRGGRGALLAMALCLALLLAWALRVVQPTLYYNVIPLDVLVYIEGTANVPIFMLFIGTVWKYPHDERARRAGPPLIALAFVYFVWNGLWMILPYPKGKEAIFYEPYLHPAAHGGVITQYSNDACVAAAAATAMLAAGIDMPVSEAEMIRLTDTRLLRGSTVARAARGLRRYLEGSGINVEVVDVNADGCANLASLDMPVLTPIKSGIGSLHMVVVYGHPPKLMDVFEPLDSRELDWWAQVTTGKRRARGEGAESTDSPVPGVDAWEYEGPVPLFRYAVRWFMHFPSDMGNYVIIGNPLPEESDVAVNVPRGIQVVSIERFRKLYAGPTIFFHHERD